MQIIKINLRIVDGVSAKANASMQAFGSDIETLRH